MSFSKKKIVATYRHWFFFNFWGRSTHTRSPHAGNNRGRLNPPPLRRGGGRGGGKRDYLRRGGGKGINGPRCAWSHSSRSSRTKHACACLKFKRPPLAPLPLPGRRPSPSPNTHHPPPPGVTVRSLASSLWLPVWVQILLAIGDMCLVLIPPHVFSHPKKKKQGLVTIHYHRQCLA